MYINFNLLRELVPGDIEKLTAVKQIQTEYLIKYLTEDDLRRFEALSLLERVKPKKKDEHSFTSLRLSKKGKKLLADLSFEGAVDEESRQINEWLIDLYKKKSGGIVNNKTECGRRLHWFKTITGIRGNFLAVLLQSFLSDCYDPSSGLSVPEFKEQNPRGTFSNMLDNLAWKPPNNFAHHYTLDNSPLYSYYEDNEEYINTLWKKILDKNGNKL